MKKSTSKPFMAAPDYGRSLAGFTVNLLSPDLARSLEFQRDVLRAEILHTYDKHPLLADTSNQPRRGAGVELRLHGCDPDAAAQRALQHGFRVLDGPRDQPDHGLRETHIIDGDGYVWVPDQPL